MLRYLNAGESHGQCLLAVLEGVPSRFCTKSTGRLLSSTDIVEFVQNLRDTEFFQNIKMVEVHTDGDEGGTLYHFSLNLTLKGEHEHPRTSL